MSADSSAATVTVEAWEGGAAFGVKVHAGARRDAVGGVHDGRLRVSVTAAPEKGKANKAVLSLLARYLAVPPSSLTLLAGQTDPRKRIGASTLSVEALRRRLAGECGSVHKPPPVAINNPVTPAGF